MSAERFQVQVNYSSDKSKPNVSSSLPLSFEDAIGYRDLAKEQRTPSWGIILVDTQRQLVEVSLGEMKDFAEVTGFTQVDQMTDD